jgi:hypothetical protein
VTAGERRQHVAQKLGAAYRVELVATLGEAGRRVEVVVGAEGHDEDLGVVNTAIGRHPSRFGVDGGDRLAQEADAGLVQFGVRQADLV